MIILRPPLPSFGSRVRGHGHTRCYRCRLPWWANPSKPRTVTYATDRASIGAFAARGMFALCQHCWTRSSYRQRLRAHRWIHFRYCRDMSWPAIAQAIARLNDVPADTDLHYFPTDEKE